MKKIIHRRPVVDREEFLIAQVQADLSVLHLGCTDSPYTAESIARGRLLHARLLNKSSEVVGFDLSKPSLELVEKALPQGKYIEGNAEALQKFLPAESFDLIIAGEILEHLSNAGLFLSGCKHALKKNGRILISVPNVFGSRRFVHSLFGVENYHPEHTCYFSENTIAFLAQKSGLELSRSFYYPTDRQKRLSKKILYFFVEQLPSLIFGSHFMEGLVVELKVKS